MPFPNDSNYGGPLAGYSGGGPLSGQGGGLGGLLDPQYAFPMAAQLIGGRTPQESFAGALSAAGPAIGDIRQRAAINAWLKSRSTGQPLSPEIQQYIAQNPALASKLAEHDMGLDAGGGGSGFGDTPLYFTKDGKRYIGRFNDQGGVTMATPEGFEVSEPITYLNTGDKFVPSTRRGGVEGAAEAGVAPVPIDTEAAARGAKTGAGQGEATVDLRRMEANMPSLEATVEELGALGDKATYTEAGKWVDAARRQFDQEPRESAIARREYIATVDNQVLPLLRQTFGAAFTEKEGASLKATLGDPDMSPQEKRAVIKAFIRQKRRDVAAMAAQTGQAAPAAANAPANAPADGGVVKAEDFFK
jgi:hypothetical protein